MDKPMSKVGFKLMTLVFRIRDFLRPRMDLLKEAGIEPGFCILDYGCGPGSYIAPLCESCALQAHKIQLPEMAAAVKLSQQLRTEYCVNIMHTMALPETLGHCSGCIGRRNVTSAKC